MCRFNQAVLMNEEFTRHGRVKYSGYSQDYTAMKADAMSGRAEMEVFGSAWWVMQVLMVVKSTYLYCNVGQLKYIF